MSGKNNKGGKGAGSSHCRGGATGGNRRSKGGRQTVDRREHDTDLEERFLAQLDISGNT